MNKLNRELMEKWVAALRSGEYKQGTESLYYYDDDKNSESYCCLGVLQAIKPDIEQMEDDELLDEDSLKKFLGVGEYDGFIQGHYADMNDSGVPFSEIANRLEKQWLNNEENK
jgi:hypothetical protein